jgi:transcription elongation factor Elf1
VIPVEKRKEYAEGDIKTCPKCDSDDVDYEEAPSRAKCQSCGLEFEIRTVAIWNE